MISLESSLHTGAPGCGLGAIVVVGNLLESVETEPRHHEDQVRRRGGHQSKHAAALGVWGDRAADSGGFVCANRVMSAPKLSMGWARSPGLQKAVVPSLLTVTVGALASTVWKRHGLSIRVRRGPALDQSMGETTLHARLTGTTGSALLANMLGPVAVGGPILTEPGSCCDLPPSGLAGPCPDGDGFFGRIDKLCARAGEPPDGTSVMQGIDSL